MDRRVGAAPAASASAIRAIGIIESCFQEKFGAPRQPGLVPASQARLKIFAKFLPEHSLRGLERFSHLWLLSYFHLNTNKSFLPTVHPPRLKGETVGVFASRSPHRPSPIGLSLARLRKIEGDTLHLSGIDLVSGTPILDIKPYIPSYDCQIKARGGWAAEAPQPKFPVGFSDKALARIKRRKKDIPGLKTLISQILAQDLRNPRDRSQLLAGKSHELRIWNLEVVFYVRGRKVLVEDIRPAAPKSYLRPGRVPPEIL